MRTVSSDIREGRWRGATGARIRHVVNIGIGGSDLGPLLVCEALAEWRSPDVDVCFVSNVDPAHLARTLERIDPALPIRWSATGSQITALSLMPYRVAVAALGLLGLIASGLLLSGLHAMLAYAVANIVMGFALPGVDNWAHVGGFAGGWLVGRFLDPAREERGDHLLIALVLLLLTVVSIVASLLVALPGI